MGRECSKTEKMLERYSDGELSRRKTSRAESHLATCQQCRARLESLKSLQRLVVESVEKAPGMMPEGFWDRVEAGLDTSPPRRMRWPWLETFPGWVRPPRRGRPAWALASAAVAVVLLLVMLHPWRQPVVASNECEIDFLETEYSTVIVLDTPDSKMKIIWVGDSQLQSEEDVPS